MHLQYQLENVIMIFLPKRNLLFKNRSTKESHTKLLHSTLGQRSENVLYQTLNSQPQSESKQEKLNRNQKQPYSRIKTQINQAEQTDCNDIEKLIIKNKLTLNLIDQQNISLHELPTICSFAKINTLLVASPLYQKYRESNSCKDDMHSLLSKLEREYDANAAKIKIHKNSKKLLRNSRFVIKQTSTFAHTQPNSSENPFTHISTHSIRSPPPKKTHKSVELPTQFGSRNKWRLKDFYEHIALEAQDSHTHASKLRQRQSIISKLKRISDQCDIAQDNSKEIVKSIAVFAKYNQNLAEKLIKKQRKIDKIYYYQHY